MEFRKSQWTESISSLLRKTEMNLIRIQTPFHEEVPRNYTSMTYQASFYDNPINEHHPRPQTDFKEDSSSFIQQELTTAKSSLEKMLHEKIKQHKKYIEDIGERVVALEINKDDLERFKDDTRVMVESIEKKCLAEVRRIENSGKGFVSQEDMKVSIEALKQANVNQLKLLEKEIEQFKSGDLGVKEEVFRITEEKIREITKKFVGNQEFHGVKEGVLKEASQRLKEFEIGLNGKFEGFRLENEKYAERFEEKLENVSEKHGKKEQKLLSKLDDLERALENIASKQINDVKSLKADISQVNELINIEDLEGEVHSLKKQIASLPTSFPEPDLSNVVHKKELKVLLSRLEDSENTREALEQKVADLEKRLNSLENQSSEEIDIDLAPKQIFANKGAATFGKKEEENSGLTKICINDFGESDSESHGGPSPHTSPMNQFSGLTNKKVEQFDFKKKTDLHIKNSGLIMIDEDPHTENITINVDEENREFERSRIQKKVEIFKPEIKNFPVEEKKIEKGFGKSSFDSESEEKSSESMEIIAVDNKQSVIKRPEIPVIGINQSVKSETVPILQQKVEIPQKISAIPVKNDKKAEVFEIDDFDFDLDFSGKNVKQAGPIEKNFKQEVPIEIKKPLKPIEKIQEKSNFDGKTSEFIKDLTEQFIDEEILFGCKSVLKPRNEPPSLKIPQSLKEVRRPIAIGSESSNSDESFGEMDLPLPYN